ncbi:MAG: hypothetical protein C4523_10055 [Myxococcales bacterium]|nr:MAG: hypothetical protein C4523_10055 [Myxococcales bacterium]
MSRHRIGLTARILAILAFLLLGFVTPAFGQLLIIYPYDLSGSPEQQDTNWYWHARLLADYKSQTGMQTEILALGTIRFGFSGRDLPERIKRAIYHYADERGVRYVMLIGNGELIPARYFFTGYVRARTPAYNEDGNQIPRYCYKPTDSYYANLWADDDNHEFDDWDANDNLVFGETYRDSWYGVDHQSIRPDVAVGRVLCDHPDQLLTYINKIIQYEIHIATSPGYREALIIGGFIGEGDDNVSRALNRGNLLTAPWLKTYLLHEPENAPDAYRALQQQGTSDIMFAMQENIADNCGGAAGCQAPNEFITDFLNSNAPQYINYSDHGSPGTWSSYYHRNNVGNLNYTEPAAIAFGDACQTGEYLQDTGDEISGLVAINNPVTAAGYQRTIAETFLLHPAGGAVGYIGAAGVVQPTALNSAFIRELNLNPLTLGDAYKLAVERVIRDENLEGTTESGRVELDEDDPRYGLPAYPGNIAWTWTRSIPLQHIMRFHLFGDPSLRINGVQLPGDTNPPVTVALYKPLLNLDDTIDDPHHFLRGQWIRLVASDAETIPITTNYRIITTVGPTVYEGTWREGNYFPVSLDNSLAMNPGTVVTIEFHSTDLAGNVEATKSIEMRFDLDRPDITLEVVGQPVDIYTAPYVTLARPVSIRAIGTDGTTSVVRMSYSINGGMGVYANGDTITVDLSCEAEEIDLLFNAFDEADNFGFEMITLRLEPLTPLQLLTCVGPITPEIPWVYHYDQIELFIDPAAFAAPPEEMRIDIWGPDPSPIEFPVNPAWVFFGEAVRPKASKPWYFKGSTLSLTPAVENGWYWLRAIDPSTGKGPDPMLLYINNFGATEYTLENEMIVGSAKPGETIEVKAIFTSKALGELQNLKMGLRMDGKYFDNQDVMRTRASLAPDETWSEMFYLTVNSEMQAADDLALFVWVGADDADGKRIYLDSEAAKFVVLPPDRTISGSVMALNGKAVEAATVHLYGVGVDWYAETDEQGTYSFESISVGEYLLEVIDTPEPLRTVEPAGGRFEIDLTGERDLSFDFAMTGPDVVAPDIEQQLRWEEFREYGYLYGFVSDGRWGSGFDDLGLTIADLRTGRWLDASGNWVAQETWLEPDAVLTLEELRDQIETLFASLPRERLDQEIASILDRLYEDSEGQTMAWAYKVKDLARFAPSYPKAAVKAWDYQGNVAMLPVQDVTIEADFTADDLEGKAPLTVHFTDLSDGLVEESWWDYGDGATGASPVHVYEKAGTYSVTMSVNGPAGSDEKTRTSYIKVNKSGCSQMGDSNTAWLAALALLLIFGLRGRRANRSA